MQTPFPKERKSIIFLWDYTVWDLAADPNSWVEEDRGKRERHIYNPLRCEQPYQKLACKYFQSQCF